MNFDDYATLWRAQPGPSDATRVAEREALIASVRQRALRFDRTILWRDLREFAATLFLLVVFSHGAWRNTGETHFPWAQWSAVLIVLGEAVYLIRERRNTPRPAAAESPLLVQIEGALAGLRYQARVLMRVPWTYALPFALAGIAFGLGDIAHDRGSAAVFGWAGATVTGVCLLVGGGVAWLNRFTVKFTLQPRIHQLEQTLRELNADSQTP